MATKIAWWLVLLKDIIPCHSLSHCYECLHINTLRSFSWTLYIFKRFDQKHQGWICIFFIFFILRLKISIKAYEQLSDFYNNVISRYIDKQCQIYNFFINSLGIFWQDTGMSKCSNLNSQWTELHSTFSFPKLKIHLKNKIWEYIGH